MKNWYQSRTLWFNLLTLIVSIGGELTHAFSFNEQTLKVIGIIVLVGNSVLRLFTNTGIGSSK